MSSLTTLARPYAKAAFEVAHGHDSLAYWGSALGVASQVVADEAVANWLLSPTLNPEQVITLIGDATGGKPDAHFTRFLVVLSENDRLALLPEITALFGELRADAENRLEVRVVSAYPLADDQAERMKAALAKRYERTIELRNEVDASMMGGAVIYAGDEVIDGSVRGRIARLQGSLA